MLEKFNENQLENLHNITGGETYSYVTDQGFTPVLANGDL